MKKWTAVFVCLLLTLLCAAAAAEVKIDGKTFPDKQFRAYINEKIDQNGDGKLSNAEISAVKQIACHSRSIGSLKGIEVFTKLESLSCSDNRLTELDVSKNTELTTLMCGGNRLIKLDVSKNRKLQVLGFEQNKIKTVDLSGMKELTSLSCGENPMKKLNVSDSPVLAELVTKAKPKDYAYGFYGWWQDNEGRFPTVTLFVPRGINVVTNDGTATVSGLKYTVDREAMTAVFTGAENKKTASVMIPDTIQDNGKTYKVTGIAAEACKGMENLTSVTVGKNVEKIGKSAFGGCKNLRNITLRTAKLKAKGIGGGAFSTGCAKTTVKCPKDRLEDYKKILLKKGLAEDAKFVK